NLLSVLRDAQTLKSFTYDEANRISSPGYDYDARGSMTTDPTRRFTYDGANRLTAVIDASSEATIAAYAYDYLNRRISATDASGTATYFHYDGASPNAIAETDGAGEVIATYAYDDRGQLHSMTRGGQTYYYHVNAHGDVVALTDASGQIVNTYRYDPWGEVLDATEAVANPYRYAGYRCDEATGLYYLWNRYYDPGTCRFISKDPDSGRVIEPGTLNPYSYCGNNPVNRVDATGGSWSWIKNKASAVMEAARNAVEAVGNYLRSSRWSILPSKPDEIDWALMCAGATGDALAAAAGASGAASGAAAGSAAGPYGAGGGAVLGGCSAYAKVQIANSILDVISTTKAACGVVDGTNTFGDVAMAASGLDPGFGSTRVLLTHTAMFIADGLSRDGFYARPSW
ncbi:MAG: hypothetical protein IBX63_08035, partial [Coriobacteriia bacterium]|nr:hypothetical protein [Coriobacteriia bacterium]